MFTLCHENASNSSYSTPKISPHLWLVYVSGVPCSSPTSNSLILFSLSCEIPKCVKSATYSGRAPKVACHIQYAREQKAMSREICAASHGSRCQRLVQCSARTRFPLALGCIMTSERDGSHPLTVKIGRYITKGRI